MAKPRLVLAGKGPAYEEIARKEDFPAVGQGPLRPAHGLVCLGYSKILTAEEIDEYDFALNIHFGPLPSLRGCYPTKWAIINNEPAGVTLHHLTPKVDAGPLLSVWTFSPQGMTDLEVFQDCSSIAVRLWQFWRGRLLSGDVPPGLPQDETRARYYPRVLPFDGKYDPSWSGSFHERVKRAFDHPPHSGLSYE